MRAAACVFLLKELSMLFMIEMRFRQERRSEVLDYFWKHGTSQYEGRVTVKGAWVASADKLAYVLVESSGEEEVAKACAPLADLGEITARQVTSTDEI
jgi:hypothetical protein